MLEARNRPRIKVMTLRTVAAEALQVRVLTIMTASAVERLARAVCIELVWTSNAQPYLERLECRVAFCIRF